MAALEIRLGILRYHKGKGEFALEAFGGSKGY